MAESAGKQVLSALTEGREKGNKAAAKKSSSKSSVKIVEKGVSQGSSRSHRGVASGGQPVTSSKREFVYLAHCPNVIA